MRQRAPCAAELQGAALTRLALNTLVGFDFGSMRLLEFVRDHVTAYLDDADVSVRRAAAHAAVSVLHRTAVATPGSRAAANPQVRTAGGDWMCADCCSVLLCLGVKAMNLEFAALCSPVTSYYCHDWSSSASHQHLLMLLWRDLDLAMTIRRSRRTTKVYLREHQLLLQQDAIFLDT